MSALAVWGASPLCGGPQRFAKRVPRRRPTPPRLILPLALYSLATTTTITTTTTPRAPCSRMRVCVCACAVRVYCACVLCVCTVRVRVYCVLCVCVCVWPPRTAPCMTAGPAAGRSECLTLCSTFPTVLAGVAVMIIFCFNSSHVQLFITTFF